MPAAPQWTTAEEKYLFEHYASAKIQILEKRLGRTAPAILQRAHIMGLRKGKINYSIPQKATIRAGKHHPAAEMDRFNILLNLLKRVRRNCQEVATRDVVEKTLTLINQEQIDLDRFTSNY
jgi:hypothetical protein